MHAFLMDHRLETFEERCAQGDVTQQELDQHLVDNYAAVVGKVEKEFLRVQPGTKRKGREIKIRELNVEDTKLFEEAKAKEWEK